MLHKRTFASSDPLMKYLSSTGLNWMQVTVFNEEKIKILRNQLIIEKHLF
ncbi:hypothetical protein Hanom_Chr08g00737471 [Helianthus anomalus]